MKGILSPVMNYIVSFHIGAAEKDKLSKAIDRQRAILRRVSGTMPIILNEFGVADLLVARDNPGDWAEAKRLYNDILERAPSQYYRAGAMVGKAELATRSLKSKEVDEAVDLAGKAFRILKREAGLSDFFTAKAAVVEGELRGRRRNTDDPEEAIKVFDKIIRVPSVNSYFRARAMVGRAELIRDYKPKGISKAIKDCGESYKLLKERPNDYFTLKARVVEGELRVRKRIDGKVAVFAKAIIKNPYADLELKTRANLNMAERATQIGDYKKALKICSQVLKTKDLEEHIIERAKIIRSFIPKGAALSLSKGKK